MTLVLATTPSPIDASLVPTVNRCTVGFYLYRLQFLSNFQTRVPSKQTLAPQDKRPPPELIYARNFPRRTIRGNLQTTDGLARGKRGRVLRVRHRTHPVELAYKMGNLNPPRLGGACACWQSTRAMPIKSVTNVELQHVRRESRYIPTNDQSFCQTWQCPHASSEAAKLHRSARTCFKTSSCVSM